MNAYWKWAETGLKVAHLKEEEKVLATLNLDQIKHHCLQAKGLEPNLRTRRRSAHIGWRLPNQRDSWAAI
jgi:hypothetical protein